MPSPADRKLGGRNNVPRALKTVVLPALPRMCINAACDSYLDVRLAVVSACPICGEHRFLVPNFDFSGVQDG